MFTYTSGREIIKKYFDKHLTPEMTIYDIGCGKKPYANYLKGKVKAHIGIDIPDGFYDNKYIDLPGDAYNLPVDDNSADAAMSCHLIEHLDVPEKSIEEVARILKKGGLLFMTYPFLYPIHATPHDYNRLTEYKLEKMFEDYGFKIIDQEKSSGFWYVMGVFMMLYMNDFNRGILKKIMLPKAIGWILLNICHGINALETFILRKAGKSGVQDKWVCFYTLVAVKT